ncbi:MAG: hypothetical protein M1833_001319 [Piccolia ochrophora]|nr:MAG: hypothetical protein M1833_001319 [Piccolia ochrophora]
MLLQALDLFDVEHVIFANDLQLLCPQYSTHHSPKLSSTAPSALTTLSSLLNPHSAHAFGALTPPSFCFAVLTTMSSSMRGTGPTVPARATADRNPPARCFHARTTSATSRSSLIASVRSTPVSFMPRALLEPAGPIFVDCESTVSRFQRSLRPAMMWAATMEVESMVKWCEGPCRERVDVVG